MGRKYEKETKSNQELAELLQKYLENGELSIYLDAPRKYGEKVNFKFDPNKLSSLAVLCGYRFPGSQQGCLGGMPN